MTNPHPAHLAFTGLLMLLAGLPLLGAMLRCRRD